MIVMRSNTIDLFVVWVTTACQLHCRYCYMQAGDVPRTDLDPRLFTRALSTLPVRSGGELQIAGGEPALVPDVVAAVAAEAKRAGINRISLQTNGVGIDDKFLSLVRQYHIGVGVSLDGPSGINEVWRGRTADVLAGMRRLDVAEVPFGVTTVLTRDSLGSLSQLAMLLAGFAQARSIGLDVLRPVGRGNAADLPSAGDVAAAHRELTEVLVWINRRRRIPLRLREDKMVACGTVGAYCPAERGASAVLVPDGTLYPCSSLVGRSEYVCGTAEHPDLIALTRGLSRAETGCAACRVSGCRGRCPSRALISSKASAIDCALRHASHHARKDIEDSLVPPVQMSQSL